MWYFGVRVRWLVRGRLAAGRNWLAVLLALGVLLWLRLWPGPDRNDLGALQQLDNLKHSDQAAEPALADQALPGGPAEAPVVEANGQLAVVRVAGVGAVAATPPTVQPFALAASLIWS